MINHDESMIKHDKHMIETYIYTHIHINMMNRNEHLIKHHINAGCGQGFYSPGLPFFNFSMFLGRPGTQTPVSSASMAWVSLRRCKKTCRNPPFLETSESNTPYHSKINYIHIFIHIQHR